MLTRLSLALGDLLETGATKLLFLSARFRKRGGIPSAKLGSRLFDRLIERGQQELMDGDVSTVIAELALASALKATPKAELGVFLDLLECKVRTCRIVLLEDRDEVNEAILQLESEEPISLTFERLWRVELARREAAHRLKLQRVGIDLQEAQPC